MSSEKTEGHDLIRREGMKSRQDDFKLDVVSILKTSDEVTSGSE